MLLGDIIDSILAALAILHQKDLKNRLIYNQDELENSACNLAYSSTRHDAK